MLESSFNREARSLHSTAILCPSSSGTASVDGASFCILEHISEECVLLWAEGAATDEASYLGGRGLFGERALPKKQTVRPPVRGPRCKFAVCRNIQL